MVFLHKHGLDTNDSVLCVSYIRIRAIFAIVIMHDGVKNSPP